MASDVDLVVEAINGLKSNVFKDYIFPIGTLAISAFVGLRTSFYAVRYAEDVKADIHKIRVLNQTLLSANQMRNSLIAIKGNYHGNLLSHPIQRVLAIPPLASLPVIPQFNPIDLSFLADRVALASLDEHKWIRVEYIDTLFKNFDNAVQQWKLLTNEKRSLQPQLNGLMGIGLNSSLTIGAMHRLSELSRYNPQNLHKHLTKDASWLLSEFINKSIYQFIDQISSEITGNDFRVTGFRA
ncbi:YaaC family protein [uncultured Vibrio sp.]|uniref:YaaC family protein n=1 Tax=uncultured Vibrio sp. TaxID=114054 RepID=UPI00261B3F3F|nr:YaaC family protein [uncultured Vibrio sp.]